MEPVFFETPADFRKWLEKNYKSEKELLVGFYKKGSGRASVSWPESVDEALCFGWIDGIRRSLGDEAYTIRFTPRKPGSIWSAVNIDKIEVLISKGLVKPEGMEAYAKRTESKSRVYSHERETPAELTNEMIKAFEKQPDAYNFFKAQPPGYQKVIKHWIMQAKQEKTQLQRFEKLLQASNDKKRLQ